jgi:hypothetical protein
MLFRYLLAPAILLALAFSALAEAQSDTPSGPVAIGQAQLQKGDFGSVGLVQAPPVVVAPPAEPATSVSLGSWIADLLGSLVAVFGSVIATFLTKWVMAVAKTAGVNATQAMSDRLNDIIARGLHDGALRLGQDITGKLNVQVKSQIVAQAVAYAQTHGADTVKNLVGVDIHDPIVIEALQARAATVLSGIGPDAVLAPKNAPAAFVYPTNPVPMTAAQPVPQAPAVPEPIAPVVS